MFHRGRRGYRMRIRAIESSNLEKNMRSIGCCNEHIAKEYRLQSFKHNISHFDNGGGGGGG